jgi:RNase P subunit RPR2
MKIITRKPLGDKVVGKFTCKKCQSELEVQIKDCRVGSAKDYSGGSDTYVGFTCPVCGNFITDLPGLSYTEVDEYHKTAKAIEERDERQRMQERVSSDADGK